MRVEALWCVRVFVCFICVLAVQVLTDYMVDIEHVSPEDAAAAIEADIAATLESLMTDELQEMTWDAEFGFNKDPANPVPEPVEATEPRYDSQ